MAVDADGVEDRRVKLANGRVLGFRVYGDPHGLPVLFLHGTPGSRLKFAIAHEAGKSRGLAIVAPDRWGYGLTEAPGAPSLRAFADDMAALMDELGSDRFAVGGISGGGPYAAAVAACLAPRVAALALVSPVGPIADAGLEPSLPLLHRLCFTLLPRQPRTVSTAMRMFRWTLAHTPRLAGELTTWRAARPDKRLIRRPEVSRGILGSLKEGLRPGTAGPNIDLSIFSRPWALELAAIAAPTRLWIGSVDCNVPLAAARALARRIPHCVLTELPDEGHLWVSVHHAEVLTWVACALGSDAAAQSPRLRRQVLGIAPRNVQPRGQPIKSRRKRSGRGGPGPPPEQAEQASGPLANPQTRNRLPTQQHGLSGPPLRLGRLGFGPLLVRFVASRHREARCPRRAVECFHSHHAPTCKPRLTFHGA